MALQALDEYAAERWPGLKGRYFPAGAAFFDLARRVADDIMDPWSWVRETGPPERPNFHELVDLRNQVAHPEPRSTRQYEYAMREAQASVLELGDVARAEAIRGLRDELFREAEAAFDGQVSEGT